MSSDSQQHHGGGEHRREASMPVEELLALLARGLVDRPDEVSVGRFEDDDDTLLLELSVAEDDYGKVIGRGGRTAQALRTVVRAAAGGDRSEPGQRRRVLLDIVD